MRSGSLWLQDVEGGIKSKCQVQNALCQPGGRGQLNAVDVVFSACGKKAQDTTHVSYINVAT